MASTYLTRTPSQAGSTTKGTFSAWVKRGNVSTGYPRLFHETPSSNNYLEIFFSNGDELQVDCTFNSSVRAAVRTNRKFRDPNSFYHIMISIDSTQSTASDRIKFYVNGVQETSFAATTYPGSGDNMKINGSTGTVYIGQSGANSEYFDGSMSHVHWIDGTAYTPSAFGETDATTGEWKAKTSPSVTYGTNGFLILKDGNTITDQSSNSNDFTLGGGTLTDLKDNPDNVFATLNPLVNGDGSFSLDNGNNKFTGTGGNDHTFGTLGAIGGKFYYETKWVTNPSVCYAGFIPAELAHTLGTTEAPTNDLAGMYRDDYVINVGNVNELTYTNVSAGDIFGFAIDLSSSSGSRTLAVYKNGSLIHTMTLSTSYEDDIWLPVVGDTSATNGVQECNFGNGYFGTTAVSSAGTNASDNGIFEYDVPTGYTALSTKGLNE